MNSFTLRTQGCQPSDPGPAPMTIHLEQTARQNHTFRTALWTGNHLQLTVMCIPFRGEIGMEMHPDTDQLIRVEDSQASVRMGESKEHMTFRRLQAGDVILVPRGTWHNVVNTGNRMLKLSSVYAPPQHPRGTVHPTKADAHHEDSRQYFGNCLSL